MLEFTTLLLGLFVGSRTVAFATAENVATIDLMIDGRVVEQMAVANGSASAPVEFGEDLLPRRVRAIGRDQEGEEVAIAERWINLPHGEIEAALILRGDSTSPTSASIIYSSLSREEPRLSGFTVTVDGQQVNSNDPHNIPLPRLPGDRVRLLRSTLDFENGERIHLARLFGRGFTDEVDARLQPIRVQQLENASPAQNTIGDCLPPAARVIAVENEEPLVFVVRDLTALAPLRQMLGLEHARGSNRIKLERRVSRLAPLRSGQSIVQVWPLAATTSRDGIRVDTFPSSEPVHPKQAGMAGVMLETFRIPQPQPQRLSDAVAVAGLRAFSSGRPSAVVLLLGPGTRDRSVFTAETVRRYLEALQVPFYVWGIANASSSSPWGESVSLQSLSDLEGVVARLADELADQKVVWVHGDYLPQEICLSPSCDCRPSGEQVGSTSSQVGAAWGSGTPIGPQPMQ